MNLNKNHYFYKNKSFGYLFLLFLSQFLIRSFYLSAQESYKLNEIEINSSTKLNDDDSNELPTNPFEIVDMIRRMNSMNDATKPSEAIDDALKSFDIIQNNNEKEILNLD